jgi:MHS family proline/betaine transporter-like MFS transporter
MVFNTFFVFLPNHLAASAGVPLARGLGAAVVGLLTMAVAAPVFGRVSDAIGRRPVLAAATGGLACLTYPMYRLAGSGSFAGMLSAEVAIGLCLSAFVLPAFLAEMFPTRLRATGLALTFGLASALLGGTAPVVDALLVRLTQSEAAPALYGSAIALFAVLAVLRSRETAFQPLRRQAA